MDEIRQFQEDEIFDLFELTEEERADARSERELRDIEREQQAAERAAYEAAVLRVVQDVEQRLNEQLHLAPGHVAQSSSSASSSSSRSE